MASNTNSRKITLKISSSSSSSPKLPPTPSQSPPPYGVPMKFPLTHMSYYLNPEVKLAYDQLFTELPQSPHFNLLQNFRSEKMKEALKLGCDLAFLFLVQKLRNLNDPSKFLSETASLTKEIEQLEEMGYDLTKVKQRFNLLKKRAEREKGLKDRTKKLEEEKQQQVEKLEENKFLLVELANESLKVEKEVKLGTSEIQSIDNQKRKTKDETEMNLNEFMKLSNRPW